MCWKKQIKCPPEMISRGNVCVREQQFKCPPGMISRRNQCVRKRSPTTGAWTEYIVLKRVMN